MELVRTGIAAIALTLSALAAGTAFAESPKEVSVGHEWARRLARAATSPTGLAASHRTKINAECAACHGPGVAPDDNETVENKACVGCHGDYAKLAPETAKKLKNANINPHLSHLGPEIACTVCHAGHVASNAYCTQCHTNFTMPMPGNPRN